MTHEFCSIFIGNTVKLGRSLTPMVSPDDTERIGSKSERDVCRTTAEGKKTFLAKRYGFCRCVKTF